MKFGKLYCTLPECVLQSVLNPVKKIKIENDITNYSYLFCKTKIKRKKTYNKAPTTIFGVDGGKVRSKINTNHQY